MNSVVSHPKPPLAATELSALMKLRPLRSFFSIGRVYLLLIIVIGLCITTKNLWIILPSLLVIGALQHALSILQHEAVHGLISPKRWVNDCIGNILLSYPIGFSLDYRHIHFSHHRGLGTDQDPDMQNYAPFPHTRKTWIKKLLQDFSGIGAMTQFLSQKNPNGDKRHLIGLIITQGVIAGLFLLAHAPFYYLILWILPLVTIAKGIAQLRNVAEHLVRMPAETGAERIRTFKSSRVERFFLGPCNFNYHAEHHWYPMVPYYNLPTLRKTLQKDSRFNQYTEMASSYVSVLKRTVNPDL
jgi:fatty acid desaturase